MLYAHLKNTNNHSRQPQETPLRRYSTKNLILQGFQAAKNGVFSPFLLHFLPILSALSTSHKTKKRRNSYIFYVLEPSYFYL